MPVDQLIHELAAQTFDIHGTAVGEVQDGLLALGGAKQAARAAVIGFALFTHHFAAADRAGFGHAEVGHIKRALAGNLAHHLGNHIAGAAHDDLVAHAHAFLTDVEQIGQGGIGHHHTPYLYGCQPRHGCELAGAADLHVDGLHQRGHLLGRIFVRHGPARLARLEAQLTLQRQTVDLVDHAVDLIGQTGALGAYAFVKRYQFRSTCRHTHLRCNRKTPGFQRLQHAVVSAEVGPTLIGWRDLAQAIGKERQRTLGRNLRVQLAHRACRRIARVGKSLATGCQLALVELFQIGPHHVHLATYLDHRRHLGRSGQRQRDLANGADVVRHVLAHLAITACGGLHQHAILVAQVHGQAVKLGLGHIFDGCSGLIQAQLLAHALVKGDGARSLVVGLGLDAEHGHGMAHRCQAIQHRTDHTLRGRVRRDECGIGTFKCFELLVDAVVLAVGHRGGVQHIVFVRPLVELRTQCGRLGHHRFGHPIFDSCWRLLVLGFSGKKV